MCVKADANPPPAGCRRTKPISVVVRYGRLRGFFPRANRGASNPSAAACRAGLQCSKLNSRHGIQLRLYERQRPGPPVVTRHRFLPQHGRSLRPPGDWNLLLGWETQYPNDTTRTTRHLIPGRSLVGVDGSLLRCWLQAESDGGSAFPGGPHTPFGNSPPLGLYLSAKQSGQSMSGNGGAPNGIFCIRFLNLQFDAARL